MSLSAAEVYGFSESFLKGNFDSPQPTPDVHVEMWDICCSAHQLVSIAAPRGHAKSTSITHSYTLANVCFREATFVLLVSDTEGQAILFLSDIKRELLENESLRSLFGIKRFIKDTETDIIVEFVDGDQFRIIAKGSEQKVRGLKWRGKRPDLIVGDDLENDEIVMNEDRRVKFDRWVNNALLPCLSDDGKARLVGTILHLDSFLESTMPQFEDTAHTHTDGIKWWSTKEDRVWHSVRYQAHNEDFSKILWPEKFSQKRLEAIRRRYVERGQPEGYSQEYLNYPIDESSAYFQKKDFHPWKAKDEYLEYYIGGDLAISEKDSRAYTVFVVVGVNRDNKLVVVDIERFRADSLYIVDTMFMLQEKYKPELFFLESENIAKSIGPFLYQEMARRNQYINLEALTPSKDKEQRARSIQGRMRAGSVLFDKEAPWFSTLLTEMVTFPRGKYKDQVDALSCIGLGLQKLMPTYSAKDIADFDWDDEFADDYEELKIVGRSNITGY